MFALFGPFSWPSFLANFTGTRPRKSSDKGEVLRGGESQTLGSRSLVAIIDFASILAKISDDIRFNKEISTQKTQK